MVKLNMELKNLVKDVEENRLSDTMLETLRKIESPRDLTSIKGVGEKNAETLFAFLELGRNLVQKDMESKVEESEGDVKATIEGFNMDSINEESASSKSKEQKEAVSKSEESVDKPEISEDLPEDMVLINHTMFDGKMLALKIEREKYILFVTKGTGNVKYYFHLIPKTLKAEYFGCLRTNDYVSMKPRVEKKIWRRICQVVKAEVSNLEK